MAYQLSRNRASGPMFVGPVYTEETAGAATAELRVVNLTAPVEIHTEGGTTTGYSGFGARNDLLQNVSGVTRAGAALVTYGSASASTLYGISAANVAAVLSAGADGAGLAMGSGTAGKPLWLGTTSQLGSAEVKFYARGSYKELTDNTLAAFATLTVPSGAIAAGMILWTVYVLAAAAYQQETGVTHFNCINRAGTETCNLATSINLETLESGTLAVTMGVTTAGTNQISFNCTADTSLSPVLIALQYTVFPTAGAGTWADV